MYTLIIPTFNRHDLLLRAIDYYQNFDCTFIIADSSNNKFTHKLPNNIRYKHLPKMSGAKKICEATKDVTTPYVGLVADDDYFLESSLKAGASFLDDNPDYVSTQGRYYKFELTENQVTFSSRYALHRSYQSVESEDRATRIANTFNPYMHQSYALIRTDVFVKSWNFLDSISVEGEDNARPYHRELSQSFVPMCYGKHKALPVLWIVRDYYIFDHVRRQKFLADQSRNDNSISYHYIRFNNSIKDVEAFLDSDFFLHLKKTFRIHFSSLVSSEEGDTLCDIAFKSYIKSLTSERNEIITKIIIKSFTPNWVLNYYKMRTENQYASGIDDNVFKDDFKKIRSSVLNFKECYENSSR